MTVMQTSLFHYLKIYTSSYPPATISTKQCVTKHSLYRVWTNRKI